MKDFSIKHSSQSVSAVEPEKKKFKIPLVLIIRSLTAFLTTCLMVYGISFLPSYFRQPIKPELITIHGNQVLTTTSILSYLQLSKKTNWIDIDPFELSALLVRHPWVEQAVVHRKTDLGIDVSIVEVTPVSFFKIQDNLFLLSKDFTILSLIQSGNGWDLPVIVNNKIKQAKPGNSIPRQELKKVFELISLLQHNQALPLSAVSEIDISDPLNIQLVTIPNAVRIKLGSTDFEEKLINLQDVIPELEKEGNNIRYIDLRYQRAVVFRRKV